MMLLISNFFLFILFSDLYLSHFHNESSSIHHHHKKDHNKNYKQIKLTYYWIAKESLFPRGRDVEIKSCTGKKKVWSKVSQEFYDSLHMEGTGKLRSGKFVNCGNDDCTCFNKVPGPLGSKGNVLKAYTSGASKSLKNGTIIYIKEFDGLKLPSGETHNGCLRIDDTGYGLDKDQVDVFTFYKNNYERVNNQLRKDSAHIIVNSNCKLKKYSTNC